MRTTATSLSLGLFLVLGLAVGCKPKSSDATPSSSTTQTSAAPSLPAQYSKYVVSATNEPQYVVEDIVSDLAEQMFFAATGQLPDTNFFSVKTVEKAGGNPDLPIYELTVQLNSKLAPLKMELNVNGPIWSPSIYQGVARELARITGLKASSSGNAGDTKFLANFTSLAPETIESENQSLSAALERDFSNAVLHEEAAALLGVFMLRDHSGNFFEIRSPLCRMTAHLAMARVLSGKDAYGINGQMAEAMLLSLTGNTKLSQEKLAACDTNNVAIAPLMNALHAKNTGNFLPLDKEDITPIERLAWFIAKSDNASLPVAWNKLSDQQKQIIDIVRAAAEVNTSVEIGHALLQLSLPLEMHEITTVYQLACHKEMAAENLVPSLNELPEHCFSSDGNGTHVKVIGWGQWANFFQRHLCHAMHKNYQFIRYHWGVSEDARDFAGKCDTEFGGLRLYPFVRIYNCSTVAAYHKAEEDSLDVNAAAPYFVPAKCWNDMVFGKPPFAPHYRPASKPFNSQWYHLIPLPETTYDTQARLDQLLNGSYPEQGVIGDLEHMHDLAPWNNRIIYAIIDKKYHDRPTYEQSMALYQEMMSYSGSALFKTAKTVSNQPEKWVKLMLQAAELNPAWYYNLSGYAAEHNQEDLAQKYADLACEKDLDSIRVANLATWRVNYYLKKGNTEKARQIADFAAEVYSRRGLEAKVNFLEATGDYQGAYDYCVKIEERYEDSSDLIHFCQNYKAKTGDNRYEAEFQKRISAFFPDGMEKVELKNFQASPTDGVSINQQNDLITAAGLKQGDAIVAINGIRVHTFKQYTFVRGLTDKPEMDLIVWQGDAYRDIKASPPNHLFGVDMGDYLPH
jgi:hypothetical protein